MQDQFAVLVVEDDARSLLTITALLREQGLCVRRNTTGLNVHDHAISAAADLILIDNDLPHGDVSAICHTLAADPQTARIPIVVMANSLPMQADEQFSALGCSAWMQKPLVADDVLELVHLLDHHARMPDASSHANA